MTGLIAIPASAQNGPREYKVLATSKTSTMEKEMNAMAELGYEFAAVMGGETAFGGSEAVVVMQKNPQMGTEFKLLIKDSPNFIGVGKGEDKLRTKVNEIIAAAKAAGDLDKMAQKWLGRPAGDLPN